MVSDTWGIINHPRFLNEVRLDPVVNSDVSGDVVMALRSAARNRMKRYPKEMGLLDSLLTLLDYQDGLSLVRSIQTSPKNPWKEFEPAEFERFRAAQAKWLALDEDPQFFNVASKNHSVKPITILAEDGDAVRWAIRQVDVILPAIYRDFQPKFSSYRSRDVTAGGDFENWAIRATPTWIDELKRNPYLTIDPRSGSSGHNGEYRLGYRYPDIRDQDRLLRFVSASAIAASGRYPPTSTSEFIRLLMIDAFLKHGNNPLALYRALISIHPSDDTNGRTLRTYLNRMLLERRQPTVHWPISDFDLFFPSEVLEEILQQSSKSYSQVALLLGLEWQASRIDDRPVDFFSSFDPAPLLASLRKVGFNPSEALDAEEREWIRMRDWALLFKRRSGLFWSIQTWSDWYSQYEAVKNFPPEDSRRTAFFRAGERLLLDLNAGSLADEAIGIDPTTVIRAREAWVALLQQSRRDSKNGNLALNGFRL
ncbi:MAG: hypothetical protein AAB425_04755, partial [Bdellovibrionota bacterium]